MADDLGAAAGRKTLDMLADAYSGLLDYYRWADLEFAGSQNELGIEAYNRLRQTIQMIEKIILLLEEASQLPKHPTAIPNAEIEVWSNAISAWANSEAGRKSISRMREIEDDLQTFTDCTYFLAWRASRAISQLKGLGGFKPKGVRDVRNKLIEHVDGKDSGVFINSFGWGKDIGPVVRALRPVDKMEVFPDAGLFVNLSEFASALIQRLELRGITVTELR